MFALPRRSRLCRLVGGHPGPVFLAALALACGKDESGPDRKAALAAFADTALGSGQVDPNSAAREAEAAARREAYAKKKAEEQATEQRRTELLAGLAVLPDGKVGSLKANCTALVDAYHEFIVRSNGEDARALMEYYDNKGKILGERKGKCLKVGSAEAAACQVQALSQAPNELKGEELAILAACVDKFAPNAAEKVAAAAKTQGEQKAN